MDIPRAFINGHNTSALTVVIISIWIAKGMIMDIQEEVNMLPHYLFAVGVLAALPFMLLWLSFGDNFLTVMGG